MRYSFFNQPKPAANSNVKSVNRDTEMDSDLASMAAKAVEIFKSEETAHNKQVQSSMSGISEQVTRFGLFAGGKAAAPAPEKTPTRTLTR